MERMTTEYFARTSLAIEHYHRYQVASQVAHGVIVDCACGIGYGSQFLNQAEGFSHYYGFDIEPITVEQANERFLSTTVEFQVGSFPELPLEDGIVDTFVCLETLEHLAAPKLAFLEIRRLLKTTGLLVGSVPTAAYEIACTELYGPQPIPPSEIRPQYARKPSRETL